MLICYTSFNLKNWINFSSINFFKFNDTFLNLLDSETRNIIIHEEYEFSIMITRDMLFVFVSNNEEWHLQAWFFRYFLHSRNHGLKGYVRRFSKRSISSSMNYFFLSEKNFQDRVLAQKSMMRMVELKYVFTRFAPLLLLLFQKLLSYKAFFIE